MIINNKKIYISKEKYASYIKALHVDDDLCKYKPVIKSLAVDYENDPSMCYCELINVDEGLDNYIKLISKIPSIKWLHDILVSYKALVFLNGYTVTQETLESLSSGVMLYTKEYIDQIKQREAYEDPNSTYIDRIIENKYFPILIAILIIVILLCFLK